MSMNILHKVRRLEAGMTRAVERAAREWSRSGAHEPLEIAQAIVDAVGTRLEPAARGRYVFPFNRIHVSIAAASKDDRARFAAVMESEPTLTERITARLRDAGCETGSLQIAVGYVPRPGADWNTSEFHVDFTRGAPTAAPVPVPAAVAAPVASRHSPDCAAGATARIGANPPSRHSVPPMGLEPILGRV